MYDRDDIMFDNKLFINLYVLILDKHFELFVPVDEKVGNIVNLLDRSLLDMFSKNKNFSLLNVYSGNLYKNNDIVRNTDIQNGSKLILI